jgi:hypothetical protein
MTDTEFAVVMALSRCAIAHDLPSGAVVQQLRRMVRLDSLEPDQQRQVQALLDWHDSGRPAPTETIALQAEPAAQSADSNPTVLNALLWMYRRMKPSYGRLPFVEEAIALAQSADSRDAKLAAMTKWLEENQPDVFRRGLWDALEGGKQS